MQKQLSFLCIATYFKGVDFMKACHELGNKVYLITAKKLENKAWPRESLDDIFYLEDESNTPENLQNMATGVAYLMRSRKIDCIVALDDFDVEKGAFLRETFRIPGMGLTTAQYFRDKLAMRKRAADAGIKVPPFSDLFHDESVTDYLTSVQGPWVIKPRSEASATGIKKVHNLNEAWQVIHQLGDKRHNYLIEQFKPGNVYHVDSLSLNGKFIFTRCSGYLDTPMEVSHEGGIFRSVTVEFGTDLEKNLKKTNEQVMKAFGMKNSASHSEFIVSKEDGEVYFLETSARVGGANLVEMVEASSGINLWKEWARLETCVLKGETFKLPKPTNFYSGIIVSLARYDYPDQSFFNAPEVVWKTDMERHVGAIVKSTKRERVLELLAEYAAIIARDYHASAPVPDKPTN
jgi:biotin carboxylase